MDIVLTAIVGAAGLHAVLAAANKGKRLAIANKEPLVIAGELLRKETKENGSVILPVDSEHSAVFQAMQSGSKEQVNKIILTASGGPFRDLPIEKFPEITKEMALNHPTWNMGNKITIDSATLANKGLEIIEAVALFSVPADKIKVVIHPQSIIHSMVEFIDSSVIAQLSQPDMRLPISYALFWPERQKSDYGQINWSKMADLTFEPPDFKKFKALKLAIDVAKTGGTAPALYNAGNEIAVNAFLNDYIKFTEITDIIEETLEKFEVVFNPGLDNILTADKNAREFAEIKIKELV